MKTLPLTLAMLTSCATTRYSNPTQQCIHEVCPRAAAFEETAPGTDAVYDDTDDTCLCIFKGGRIYVIPRK